MMKLLFAAFLIFAAATAEAGTKRSCKGLFSEADTDVAFADVVFAGDQHARPSTEMTVLLETLKSYIAANPAVKNKVIEPLVPTSSDYEKLIRGHLEHHASMTVLSKADLAQIEKDLGGYVREEFDKILAEGREALQQGDSPSAEYVELVTHVLPDMLSLPSNHPYQTETRPTTPALDRRLKSALKKMH